MAKHIITTSKANASNFKQWLLLLLLYLFGWKGMAQTPSFPYRYQGVWKGTMEIWNGNSRVDTFPVEFRLMPVQSPLKYSFYMAYENPRMPLTKFYQLLVVDSVKGFYNLDEGQNLILPQQEMGGCLFGQIENMGQYIADVLRPEGEALIFELTVADFPAKVPADKVRRAPVKQLQRARMWKVK